MLSVIINRDCYQINYTMMNQLLYQSFILSVINAYLVFIINGSWSCRKSIDNQLSCIYRHFIVFFVYHKRFNDSHYIVRITTIVLHLSMFIKFIFLYRNIGIQSRPFYSITLYVMVISYNLIIYGTHQCLCEFMKISHFSTLLKGDNVCNFRLFYSAILLQWTYS